MGLMQPLIVDSDGNRVFCDDCEHSDVIVYRGFTINRSDLCHTRRLIIIGEKDFCDKYKPKEKQ